MINILTILTTNLNLAESATTSVQADTSQAASGFLDLINNFNWQAPSWDLFIILFFIISALIYGMSLGRQRIIVILVSIYMSLAVADYAPVVENFLRDRGAGDFILFKLITFVGAFLLLFFLLSRSALLKVFGGGNHDSSWWQTMLFSILQIGLLISVVLSYLPNSVIAGLSPLTQKIFINETAKFLWIVSPILAMILIRTSKRRRNLGPIDNGYY